jgi:Fe-S cluster assembly protein SufD
VSKVTIPLTTFTVDDAAALAGPDWLRRRRVAAMGRFLGGPLPTDADEIWRYSRINDLDLSVYPLVPAAAPYTGPVESAEPGSALVSAVGPRAGLVETADGYIAEVEGLQGLLGTGERLVGRIADGVTPWDAFAELNSALVADPVVIVVPDKVVVTEPIVIVHRLNSAAATFPRTYVEVGVNAQVTVVELLLSGDVTGFVAPVVELDVAEGGHLDHVVVQQLGTRVWETAYHASRVGRSGTLRTFAAALGGDYARVRTDSRLVGTGGATDILALYFGDGRQMHDFRTLQDHEGAKSTSELIFKGAVVGEATSAYSGLIRVRKGAVGTRAFQTNRNLVLSDSGLATYSVPNLEIEENEVMCSHASATGPIDVDQRFYLESRGVPAEAAERLIVLGFFDDLLARLSVPGLRDALREVVANKLAASRLVAEGA